jgi:uridine kinase
MDYAEVERLVGARLGEKILIAIDGRPLSGKSTTALKLAARFGLPVLAYDDFFAGPGSWAGQAPAYPFPFFRHHAFAQAIKALKREGRCSYRAYDWDAGAESAKLTEIEWRGPLIIEGCCILTEALAPLYDLRFFIESDPATTHAAAMARDGTHWEAEWRDMFLPSVDLYMKTKPQKRADHIVRGRGAPA